MARYVGGLARLRSVHRGDLDAAGQALWDDVVATRGAGVIDVGGGLTGPFNPWVHAPAVGAPAAALGAGVRYATTIVPRLLELAIITVAAHWRAEYEWWAHARLARAAGVPDGVVDAIGGGEPPLFALDDERTVYSFASEMVATGRTGPETYQAALALLGDAGVVELVALCGYYSLVSFTLNAFEVDLPEGAEPTWREPSGPGT
jgi:4-carboxymuconolactone decarboxylase